MEIKGHFDIGYLPIISPSPDVKKVSSVFLVKFVDRIERNEKTGCTTSLPSYGLLYEKNHQIGCMCLVVGDDRPYGVVWEWMPDCIRHYKRHYYGETPYAIGEFESKAKSIMGLFGSYHRVWWYAEKVLDSLIRATVLTPTNVDGKENLDMPDDLIGIQRYDEDSYRPYNMEETAVWKEYCATSNRYIMIDANRVLPKKGRCVIL